MKLTWLTPRLAYLGLALVGGLGVGAFAPYNRGICLVIPLLFLLYASFCFNFKQSLVAGYSFGLGFFTSQLYWLFYSLDTVLKVGFFNALLGIVGFVAYLSLYPLLVLGLFKRLQTNNLEFNYIVLFPSCWVLGEWLRGWLFTGFSWSDVAYTQVDNYLLSGFFPIIGSYGVSWLLLSLLGLVFCVILQKEVFLGRNPQLTRSLRLSIVYLIAVAIAGVALHQREYTKPYGRPLKVALIQGNVNGAEKWDNNKFLEHLDMYASMISRAKAAIVMLPETAIPMYEEYLPAGYVDDITRLAKLNHADLVIGLPRKIDDKGNYVNSATVFTSESHPYYAKSHLVPFGEYIPLKEWWGRFYIFAGIPMVGFSSGGSNQAPLILAAQKVAFNICYENGFGNELIAAARGATLMANISDMVWYGKTIAEDLHLQLSQARALENQRYYMQDTNSGLTAIINPFGQIQSKIPHFQQQMLVDYVQGRIGHTPYQDYGNYPIVMWIIVILIVSTIIKLRRKKA